DGKRVWNDRRVPEALDDLNEWTPVIIQLAGVSGRTVDITFTARGDAHPGPWDVVMLAEPVITTSDPVAAEERTGLGAADNLLIVINDSQRADTLKPVRERAGLMKNLFPVMEQLVDDGVTFTRARSVGNQTRPSTFGLLSGQLPRYGRFHSEPWALSPQFKEHFYDGQPPLLPRVLRRLGYRTYTVGNNAFLFGNQEIALDAGWDAVTDHRNSVEDTPWMTDTAIAWLKRNKDQRFAMVLNYNAPHNPYVPPDSMWLPFKPQLKDVTSHNWGYLGEIRYVDQHLERVLDTLEELDLDRRTVVVFTSDHGEIMDPKHGCWNPTWEYRCMHAHGNTLFDEEVHVPLLVRQTDRIPPGKTITAPISHIDVAPTLLGLLGVGADPAMLGRDFSGAILGTGRAPADAPILLSGRLSVGIVEGGLKYMRHDEPLRMEFARDTLWNPDKTRDELYDLTVDPDELTNLIAHPAYTDRLRAIRASLQQVQDGHVSRRPAWNHVKTHLTGESGRIQGRITTTGRILAVDSKGDGRASLASPESISVDAGHGADIRFFTSPPDAPVRFEVRVDGFPIEAHQVYVGAWGLQLLDEPVVSDFLQAGAPPVGPETPKSVGSGLFFWRETQGSSGRQVDAGGVDESVRAMMKDWGYE
ncbi:MAG: arylsulfatase A-like enzyme, partial [Myxococcota bacterium]